MQIVSNGPSDSNYPVRPHSSTREPAKVPQYQINSLYIVVYVNSLVLSLSLLSSNGLVRLYRGAKHTVIHPPQKSSSLHIESGDGTPLFYILNMILPVFPSKLRIFNILGPRGKY